MGMGWGVGAFWVLLGINMPAGWTEPQTALSCRCLPSQPTHSGHGPLSSIPPAFPSPPSLPVIRCFSCPRYTDRPGEAAFRAFTPSEMQQEINRRSSMSATRRGKRGGKKKKKKQEKRKKR